MTPVLPASSPSNNPRNPKAPNSTCTLSLASKTSVSVTHIKNPSPTPGTFIRKHTRSLPAPFPPVCALQEAKETEQKAGGFMEQAGQKISETFGAGKEKVADTFGAGKEKASEAAGGAQEKASQVAGGAKEKASEAGRTATDTAKGATGRQ